MGQPKVKWQLKDLDNNQKSKSVYCSRYLGWECYHYTLPPEQFMATKGQKLIRAKTEEELIQSIKK